MSGKTLYCCRKVYEGRIRLKLEERIRDYDSKQQSNINNTGGKIGYGISVYFV